MKTIKYLALAAVALATTCSFYSCSDDDSLGEAPRLFSPIPTLNSQKNNLLVTWNNINGATEYELTLYRVVTDADGNNDYEEIQVVTTEPTPGMSTTYTFQSLNWDEKYKVNIRCYNSTKTSKIYETSEVNISYSSKLSGVRLVDNAARVMWSNGGDVIKSIMAVSEDKTETVFASVSSADYEAGYADVYNLKPETKYTFYAYSSSDNQTNDYYAGRLQGTTKASEDFDGTYGAGKWIDIRSWDDKLAKDTLRKSEFWSMMAENGYEAVILKGGMTYNVGNDVPFKQSVTFKTGQTLDDNATFCSQSAMTIDNVTIGKLKFEDINFVGKGFEADSLLRENTNKNFGGKQVVNLGSSVDGTIEELIFKNCNIQGYRAVARCQGDKGNIYKVQFKGCTINGIGDQGIVTTTNKAADWREIIFDDCTILNVVMLGDLRASAGSLAVTVNQCTFCYAPLETTANANTPLFRSGGNANVSIDIQKTLFGPSMATTGSAGDNVIPYTAGTAGSIFLNKPEDNAAASHSFKTNFKWIDLKGDGVTYPITSLLELSFDEKTLWQDPENGNFTVIGNIGENGIGATKWFVE